MLADTVRMADGLIVLLCNKCEKILDQTGEENESSSNNTKWSQLRKKRCVGGALLICNWLS